MNGLGGGIYACHAVWQTYGNMAACQSADPLRLLPQNLSATFPAPHGIVLRLATHFNANRYLGPNFSSSAKTQSVTVGMHFAIRQSIIPWTSSILFCMEKLIKLVSIRMR